MAKRACFDCATGVRRALNSLPLCGARWCGLRWDTIGARPTPPQVRSGDTIREFLQVVASKSAMAKTVHNFVYQVVRVQRTWRQYTTIMRAQLGVFSVQFDRSLKTKKTPDLFFTDDERKVRREGGMREDGSWLCRGEMGGGRGRGRGSEGSVCQCESQVAHGAYCPSGAHTHADLHVSHQLGAAQCSREGHTSGPKRGQ